MRGSLAQPRDQRLQLFLIADLAFLVNFPVLEHYAYRLSLGRDVSKCHQFRPFGNAHCRAIADRERKLARKEQRRLARTQADEVKEMELEHNRDPVQLPRLADTDGAAVPEALVSAHRALHALATEAVAKVAAIRKDERISEVERRDRLAAVCDEFTPQAERINEVTASVAGLASEAERSALNKAVAKYDPARLLGIATAVASRPHEGKVSALLRAKSDPEAAAALFSCPAEIGALEGLDPRMTAMLRDVLIDPAVARAVSDTQFAVTRMKVGLEATVATIRKLTGIEQPRQDVFRRSV
jgi:hypothetical protein